LGTSKNRRGKSGESLVFELPRETTKIFEALKLRGEEEEGKRDLVEIEEREWMID